MINDPIAGTSDERRGYLAKGFDEPGGKHGNLLNCCSTADPEFPFVIKRRGLVEAQGRSAVQLPIDIMGCARKAEHQ